MCLVWVGLANPSNPCWEVVLEGVEGWERHTAKEEASVYVHCGGLYRHVLLPGHGVTENLWLS